MLQGFIASALAGFSALQMSHALRGVSPREGEIALAKLVEKLPLCRVIWGDDGSPYLLRIYFFRIFRERLPGVFLHYFFRGDYDRALHNHPWVTSASVILSGGYIEERRMSDGGIRSQAYFPGDLNIISGDTFHRVDLMKGGCWTLFIAGKRATGWGFSESPDHFEPHEEREERMKRDRAPEEERASS